MLDLVFNEFLGAEIFKIEYFQLFEFVSRKYLKRFMMIFQNCMSENTYNFIARANFNRDFPKMNFKIYNF